MAKISKATEKRRKAGVDKMERRRDEAIKKNGKNVAKREQAVKNVGAFRKKAISRRAK